MMEVSTTLARAYRVNELLRLHHNRVGARVTSATDTPGFAIWRTAGYPISPLPSKMSQAQFEIWRSEWFTPRQMRVADVLAPARDAYRAARALAEGKSVKDMDISTITEALKSATAYDAGIDLKVLR